MTIADLGLMTCAAAGPVVAWWLGTARPTTPGARWVLAGAGILLLLALFVVGFLAALPVLGPVTTDVGFEPLRYDNLLLRPILLILNLVLFLIVVLIQASWAAFVAALVLVGLSAALMVRGWRAGLRREARG